MTRSALEDYAVLDLNRANLSAAPVNVAINDAIERGSGAHAETTAALSGRQHRRRGMPAQSSIRLVVQPDASRRACAKSSHRGHYFESAVAPAANRGRLQVCARPKC